MKIEAWTNKFFTGARREMHQSETKMFLQLSILEKEDTEMKSDFWKMDSEDVRVPVPMRMFIKHAEGRELKISKPALVFLAFSEVVQTPGEISMYCTAMKQWQIEHQGIEITMEVLGMQLFPMGFPTHETLDELWDIMKAMNEGQRNRASKEAFSAA